MNEMETYRQRVEEAVRFLEERFRERPEIILIMGTGLGGLADHLDNPQTIAYADIPHFPRSTVASHAGNLLFGALGGKRVAALQGRFHYYEGYSARELTFPVRVLSLLGAGILVVSNAAGGLNPAYAPGSLMILRDHLNLIPDNPLRGINIDAWGPRFPDLSATYDPALIDKIMACAAKLGLANMECGVYVAIPGPSLETPAETRYLRQIGADAVGMSTVPEVIVAKHAGLKVLGVSVVSNVNDPDNQQPILLEEIIAQTERTAARLVRLLLEFFKEL
ncbi:MAG: purine-nucleoside phosphorylase [Desulfobulbaceae bacterium]|nr:purine-nucleoside phosphorylase [Desulfobulbaceae bacterium]